MSHSENASNVLRPHYTGSGGGGGDGDLKNQQSPVSLDFCLKKTRARAGKSRDYCNVKVLLRNVLLPHDNENPAFSNSSGVKSVFEKFRFLDGLVWTVGLTGEIRLRFQTSPA